MESRGNLAEDLHQWATKRMQFRPQGRHSAAKIPRPEDFKLICRGQMADIWQFVVSHVHAAQTVRNVKGNLALRSKPALSGYKVSYQSDKPFNHEREELLEQRRSLSNELTATTSAIGHTEQDLERVRLEIVSKEQSYNLTVSKLHDIRRKRALLVASSQHTHNEVAKLNEYFTRLQQKADHLKNLTHRSQEPVPMFPKRGQSNETKELILEAASTRDVRESCAVIGSFLGQVLQGSFEGDKSQLEKKRGELWQDVEKVLSNYTSSHLVAALCAHTQDTVQALEEQTANIDIRRDAEKLRFKYENGGQLSDMSCPPNVLQTVHQLLEESQLATFARFLEAESATNRAWKLHQRLVQLSNRTDQLLVKNHQSNPGALELARSLLQTEALVSSTRSILKLLEGISDELKENITRMSLEKQILFAKHQKIQDFKRIADSKQDLIRVLIKQTFNSRTKLQKDQAEILKYADRVSGSQDADMHLLTERLRNSVSREMEAFIRIPVPYLLLTTLDSDDRVAVINLSINKLSGSSLVPGNETIQKLMRTLKYPEFRAPECLLSHAVSLLTEVMDTSLMLKSMEMNSSLSNGSQATSKQLAALCREVNEVDKSQVARLLPSLQKRLNDATQALASCLQVKDVALCWWEQPAQTCTPWVTVDGLNVQQWRDKWVIAATQLRQLSRNTK